MNAAAWACLLLPLGSAVAITLCGTRISRRFAGYIATVTTMGSFAAALYAFFTMWSEDPESRCSSTS
jgi:NADH:ubiquinone oxidoreductase subunit 5 (subunit L)/multisubunit Na+/H+ antiporter MnhA subunit